MDNAIEWIVDFFEFFQIPIVLGVGYFLFKKFVPRSSYAEPGELSLPYKILSIFTNNDANYSDDDDDDSGDRHYYTDMNGNVQYTTEPKSPSSEYGKSQFDDRSSTQRPYE